MLPFLYFHLGTFIGAVLLLQIELVFVVGVFFFFSQILGISPNDDAFILANIIAALLLIIFVLGHIKATIKISTETMQKEIDQLIQELNKENNESIENRINILKSEFTQGLFFRFKLERQFILDIINLNFFK